MPLENMHVHTVILPGGAMRIKATHLTTGETVISDGVSRREAKAKAYATVAQRVGLTREDVQMYTDKAVAEKDRVERKQAGDLVFEAFEEKPEDIPPAREPPRDPEPPIIEIPVRE